MRTRVIAAVACSAAWVGCGPSERRSHDDDNYTFDLDLTKPKRSDKQKQAPDPGRYLQDPLRQNDTTPDPGAPAAQSQMKVKPPPPVQAECIDNAAIDTIRYKGDRLIACTANACATWSKATGKFLKTEPVFAVEAEDTTATNDPSAATLATDPPDPDAEDPRVTLDGDAVQACPEDRICMRFMPLVKDGETLDSVRGDAKHRAVAVVVSASEVKDTHVDVWDLEAGRLRNRAKFAGLDPDQTYTYQVRAYGDAFVAFAKRDDNSRATAVLLGLDGTKRATLAGGTGWMNMDQIVEPAPGQLALLDMGAPGKPYNVYIHAMPSGGVINKTTIPMIGTDDDVSLVKMEHGMLGVTQWKTDTEAKLRVDVIDPKSGSRVFLAPGC